MGIREEIEETLQKNEIVLFLNGTREAPECAASAMMVDMLDAHLREYEAVNVAVDPAVAKAVQEFFDDATIPQLCVRKQHIGGAEEVRELISKGELAKVLGRDPNRDYATPQIIITPEALEALKSFAEDDQPMVVRIRIDAGFKHSLDFDKERKGDFVVAQEAITFVLDPTSAARASGMTIEFEEDAEGGSFKIDNPKKPVDIKSIEPIELRKWMDEGVKFEFYDVRPTTERAIAWIEGSHSFDAVAGERLAKLETDTPIVLYCRDGERSETAARHCIRLGFRAVYKLAGGIERWVETVERTIAR